MYFLILVLLVMIMAGFPVSFAIALTSLFYILKEGIPLILIPQRMVAGIDTFVFLAVPFFILAGNLMNTGGVTKRIFRFANSLVGFIPGGLGHANVVASLIFAGMSGAAIADAGGLGTIEIKAMKEQGYPVDFSAGVTAASSTIGPIFPPSIPMILYGAIAGVSVGGLFLAGIFPGILMALALMVMIFIYSKRRSYPVSSKLDFTEIFASLKEAMLPLFAPVIILGGIIFGIFTPTEAGMVAAVYSFILGFLVYREIHWGDLPGIILKSALTTTVVLFIISTSSIYGWLLCNEQVPQNVARTLFAITSNPQLILLVLVGFLLLVGCFIETAAALIILVPVLAPISTNLGIDPIHFGVLTVFSLMLGLCTPPVGIVLYTVSDVANIEFEKVVSATLPFLFPLFTVLLLVTFFPQLVLFIPKFMIP